MRLSSAFLGNFFFLYILRREAARFCDNTEYYLELFVIPSTLTSVPQHSHWELLGYSYTLVRTNIVQLVFNSVYIKQLAVLFSFSMKDPQVNQLFPECDARHAPNLGNICLTFLVCDCFSPRVKCFESYITARQVILMRKTCSCLLGRVFVRLHTNRLQNNSRQIIIQRLVVESTRKNNLLRERHENIFFFIKRQGHWR